MNLQGLDFGLNQGEIVVAKFMIDADEKLTWAVFKQAVASTPLLGEPYVVTNQRLVVLGRDYKVASEFPLGGLGIVSQNVYLKAGRQIGDLGFFKDQKLVFAFEKVVGPQQVIDVVLTLQKQIEEEKLRK